MTQQTTSGARGLSRVRVAIPARFGDVLALTADLTERGCGLYVAGPVAVGEAYDLALEPVGEERVECRVQVRWMRAEERLNRVGCRIVHTSRSRAAVRRLMTLVWAQRVKSAGTFADALLYRTAAR